MTDQEHQESGGLDVETLEASFAAIAPDAERLVERFYEELFDRYPSVQPMFAKSDMKSQQAKLLAARKLVIANLRDTGALVPALQELGRRHESYGAKPEHYQAVAATPLDVMSEIAGPNWTPQFKRPGATRSGSSLKPCSVHIAIRPSEIMKRERKVK